MEVFLLFAAVNPAFAASRMIYYAGLRKTVVVVWWLRGF